MTLDKNLVEEMVTEYGEERRRVITDSLAWLETAEPSWNLDKPLDRRIFIHDLLSFSRPLKRKEN